MIGLSGCKTSPVVIERPIEIDFRIASREKTELDQQKKLAELYRKAWFETVSKFLDLIEEIKAAEKSGLPITVIDDRE